MYTTDDPSAYLERAEMHEQLAATTDDGPARKVHLAMAAEYRRRAQELSVGPIQTMAPAGQMLKLDVALP